MEQPQRTSPSPPPHHPFLFNLFGKHLTQPSFSQLPYLTFQIVQFLIVLSYIAAHNFFPLYTLKISFVGIQDEAMLLSMKVLFLFLFGLCLCFLTTVLLLFLFSYFYCSETSATILDKYLKRVINKSRVLFKTILMIPILHIVLAILDFRYIPGTSSQLLWLVLGCVGLAEISIFSLMFCLTPSKINPYSQHPWSQNNQLNQFVKTVIKVFIVALAQYPQIIPQSAFFGIVSFLFLTLNVSHLFYCKRFQERVKRIEQYSMSILLWVAFSCFILSLSETDSVLQQGIFLVSGSPLSALTLEWLSSKISSQLIQNLQHNSNPRAFLLGVIEAIKSIEKGDFVNHYSQHRVKCKALNCPCMVITTKLSQNMEINEMDYYNILQGIIVTRLQSHQQSPSVSISTMLAYIYLYKFNKPPESIRILNRLKQQMSAMGLYDRYKIDVLESTISSKMKKSYETQNKTSSQINQCYEIYKEITHFREGMYDLSENIKQYWNLMSSKEYQVDAIYQAYSLIFTQSQQIKEEFDCLVSKHGDMNGMVGEYVNFRNRFLNENTRYISESFESLSRDNGEGKYLDPISVLFLPTSKPGVISVFLNEHNFNQIHYMNHHLLNKTQYFQKNIIGEPLDRLIPEPFRHNHSNKMKVFLNQSLDSPQSQIHKRMQMIDSQNNIFCSTMTMSLIYNISEELLLVGVMSLEEQNQHILHIDQGGRIYGSSKRFQEYFGDQVGKNIRDLVASFEWEDLHKGESAEKGMVVVNDDDDYFGGGGKPISLRVKLKQIESVEVGYHRYHTLWIQNMEECQAESHSMRTIGNQKQESSIHESIHLQDEEDSGQLESAKIDAQLENLLYSPKQSRVLIAMRVLGILVFIICLLLCVRGIVRFSTEIALCTDHSALLLRFAKSNYNIIKTSLISRRMNLQAYYRPDDEAGYLMQKAAFDSTVISLNQQYYALGNSILRLEELGFDRKSFNMSSKFYEYPNSFQNTEFYNSLTMYIHAVIKISNASKSDLNFTPLRDIYAANISVYKAKLEDIAINTYGSIVPLFRLLTPAVHQFYKSLIHQDDSITIVSFAVMLVLLVGLGAGTIIIDHYYTSKLQLVIDNTLSRSKVEITGITAGIENYQSTKLKQYYQAEWEKTLFMFFAKEEKQNHQSASTSQFDFPNGGLKQPQKVFSTPRRKKGSRSSSRKTSMAENQEKEKFKLPFRLRQIRHLVVMGAVILMSVAYFGVNNSEQSTSMRNIMDTTDQFYDIIERVKYVDNLNLYTIESVFEMECWPDNISLVDLARGINQQLFEHQKTISQFRVTYPEWTNSVINLNTVDICSDYAYYGQNNGNLSSSSICRSLFNGTLTKGLSVALATFGKLSQDLYNLPVMTDATINTTQFITKYFLYNSLTTYILSASKSLIGKYETIIREKKNSDFNQVKIAGIVFGVSIGVFIIAWNYIINRLDSIGDQVKGIISLITLARISKTKSIKDKIVGDKIIDFLK